MNYCKKCVYPINAVNLNIGEDGICSACSSHNSFDELDPEFWKRKEEKFSKLISRYKKNNTSKMKSISKNRHRQSNTLFVFLFIFHYKYCQDSPQQPNFLKRKTF